MNRLAIALLPMFALSSFAGCGGGRVSTFLIGSDRCVEWVFEAPVQWGTSMMGCGFAYGAVNGAAVTDDGEAVVVLTNYGGSWAWLEPCNAYLLDIRTGKTIRRLRGPYDTHGKWYLRARTAYVKGTEDERKYWFALDLKDGTICRLPGWPKGKLSRMFGGGYFGRGPSLLIPRAGEPYCGVKDVGNGRRLVCGGNEVSIQTDDAPGRSDVRRIGRLAKLGEPHVLVNDRRRLIFAAGAYLICVDVRRLPGPGKR